MNAKKTHKKAPEGVKRIVLNRKALFNYQVIDHIETGIVLTGTEVKSLRDGKIQLVDAYAHVERGEVYLHHAHIAEYTNGNIHNHDPIRTRKLLLHRQEIFRLEQRVKEKGLTLVPLELYFKRGRVKVKLGFCRGKALHDKRAAIRDRDERRDLSRRDED